MKEVHGGNIYKYERKMHDFSANLNPLGMPEEVKEAIIGNICAYEAYPDTENRELTAAVSGASGVPGDFLAFGNGAADLIFRLSLYLKPEKTLIISPTFAEYEEAAKAAGSEISRYFLTEETGFRYDEGAEEAVTDGTNLVFICNPNNPTGIPVEKEKMRSLASRCREKGAVLVIDECFSDFLEEEERYSFLPFMEDFKNVIILKAFTKIFAMAGLRLGYAISSDGKLIEGIKGTLQPWAVNTPASKAGAAAAGLSDFVRKTKEYVKEEREYLVSAFANLGLKTYGSKANYVLVKSGVDLKKELEGFDIMVRSCGNYPGLDNSYFRFAVRTRKENEYLIECLKNIFRKERL